MSMVTGIDARTGQEIQVDRVKLINTYMPEEWSEMVSKALEKAMAERAASGEGPRNGINVLIDGEYHFFSFEEYQGGRSLSAEELAAFQRRYAAEPCMNTLWKILAELSQMGVVDGLAAFQEYQMAEKRAQAGYDPFGIVPGGPFTVETLLSRLDNVLYSISIDKTQDAESLQAETRKYEGLQEMIRKIV